MLIVQIEDGPGKALRLGLLPRRPFQRRENRGGSWSAEQADKSLRLIICLLPLVKIGMRERRLGRLSQTLTKCLRKSCFSSLCHPWALPAVLHGTTPAVLPRSSKDLLRWLLPWAQNSVWVGKKSCCSGKRAKRRRKTETQLEEVRLCWGNGPERRGQLAASNNHFWDSH